MNIVVCVKQVPDTAAQIKVKEGQIDREGIQYVVNPYDEYAVEEALRIKDKFSEGKVTLVTCGPERAKEAIKSGLAMGGDEGAHLWDEAFAGSDPYAIASILAKALEKIDYDLILCGWKGVDEDHGQVGITLAELLNIPHVSFVVKLDIADDGSKAVAEKEIEGGHEIVETTLPAVISAQKGLNEPRYASLKGIMSVKKKTIHEWGIEELGIDPATVGEGAAKIKMVDVQLPPARQPGRIIPGEPTEAARKLVRLLREEAKVV